jgi:hypothetical protein
MYCAGLGGTLNLLILVGKMPLPILGSGGLSDLDQRRVLEFVTLFSTFRALKGSREVAPKKRMLRNCSH